MKVYSLPSQTGTPESPQPFKRVSIYYSYAREDTKFLADLLSKLSLLRQDGFIHEWHEAQIIPGAERKREVIKKLNQAQIFLPLISSDYFNSEETGSSEMPLAFERYGRKELIIIPVLLRPSEWKCTPLSRFQSVPRDGRPISAWRDKDEAWVEVVTGLRLAIEALKGPSIPAGDAEESPAVPLGRFAQLAQRGAENPNVLGHHATTSLHLLFSLIDDGQISYPSKRGLRGLLNSEGLLLYLKTRASDNESDSSPYTMSTTVGYEKLIQKAQQLTKVRGGSEVDPMDLLAAIAEEQPPSIKLYLDELNITWQDFIRVALWQVRRGVIRSPGE